MLGTEGMLSPLPQGRELKYMMGGIQQPVQSGISPLPQGRELKLELCEAMTENGIAPPAGA